MTRNKVYGMLSIAAKAGHVKSGELAAEIRKRSKNGKMISKAEFGKLVRTMYGETTEKIGNIAKNVLQENIVKDMRAAGVENAE